MRIRSLQLFHLGGHRHPKNAGIDSSLLLLPLAGKGDKTSPFSKVDWILDFLGNLDAIPTCTNSLIDIHASSSRSDKTLDILGRRDERIIDTLCVYNKKITDPVFPASEDEAAVFFDNGRFPRRFCILIKPAFCIGVLRRSSAGLLFLFLSIPYIWCLGVLFSPSSRKRRLSIITIKSPNGSRVHEFIKEKEYRHIERLFWRTGWGRGV